MPNKYLLLPIIPANFKPSFAKYIFRNMKKWIAIFSLSILLIIGSILFFLPSKSIFSYETQVNCTENAIDRQITNKDLWRFLWPQKNTNKNIFSFKNCRYRIDKFLLNGFETTIFNQKDSAKATLQIASLNIDSSKLTWTVSFHFTNNPLKRLWQFSHFRENITTNIQDLSTALKLYFQKEENVYGMKVVNQKVTDSSLISTKKSFTHYPSSLEIYSLINSLKKFIKQKKGIETNYPMLNVHKETTDNYVAMVAIPTNHDLPSEGKFQLKKMVLGNILMAEIKGGQYRILKGEQELQNYVNDYKKVSPAIPYQSLVTNRLLEMDTTKWITRLYYPIFY